MQKYDVAAYIWPAYTGDEPRTRIFWEEGIGEWQSVKNAKVKYSSDLRSCSCPHKPLWGYVNEADPYVMEMELAAAADHGVNVFIYDWYWYDGRPFLENCLNDGYLKAKNNDRVKFYLMWANHNVTPVWDIRNSHDLNTLIWDGAVDEIQFNSICDRIIAKYFSHPSYYRIDGKPVFMIYDVENLIRGLGGIDNTRRRLDKFREKCVAAGLGGLHLQLVQWGDRMLTITGADRNAPTTNLSTVDIVDFLGYESMSNYQFCHFIDINRDYTAIMTDVVKEWEKFTQKYTIPYFPHVSIGWDNNPRFRDFRDGIVKNNTPENFKKALVQAKEYIDTHTLPAPLVTINSWNEWTETSYLEPDDQYGYGYLQAVKEVFGE